MAAAAAAIGVLFILLLRLSRPLEPVAIVESITQLTDDGEPKPGRRGIFTDGSRLYFDEGSGRMLATSRSSPVLYSIDPATGTFTGTTTGYRLYMARTAGGVRFAASLEDGVLMEPAKP